VVGRRGETEEALCVLPTLEDGAVQKDGVPRRLHHVPGSVERHLQAAQVLPEGVGLHHRDLSAIVGPHHEGVGPGGDLGGRRMLPWGDRGGVNT